MFVLNLYARGVSRPEISKLYAKRFDRPDYNHKKVRYVIEQFGKNPKYRNLLVGKVPSSKVKKNEPSLDIGMPVVKIKDESPSPGAEMPQDEPVEGIRKTQGTKKALCEVCNGTGVVDLLSPVSGGESGHGQIDRLATHASRTPKTTGLDDSPSISKLATSFPGKGRLRPRLKSESPVTEKNDSFSSLSGVSLPITNSTDDTHHNTSNTYAKYASNFWENVLSDDRPATATESYHMPTTYDTTGPRDTTHYLTTADTNGLAALPPNSFYMEDHGTPSWSEFPGTSPAPSLKRSYDEFQSPPPSAGLAPSVDVLDPVHASPLSWTPGPPIQSFDYNPPASAGNYASMAAGSSYSSSGSASGSDVSTSIPTFPPEPSTETTIIPHGEQYQSITKRARLSATAAAAAALLQLSSTPYISPSSLLDASKNRVAGATARATTAAAVADWDLAAALPSYYAIAPTPTPKTMTGEPEPEPALTRILKVEGISGEEGETDTAAVTTTPAATAIVLSDDPVLFDGDLPPWEEEEEEDMNQTREDVTTVWAAETDTTVGTMKGVGEAVAETTTMAMATTTQALPNYAHKILDDDDDDNDYDYPYGATITTGMQ